MDQELFNRFIEELKDSPGYVKENVMCYFWHNTCACRGCPKTDCKVREPVPFSSEMAKNDEIPVQVTEWYWFSVPNPEKDYSLFCHVIKMLGKGEYVKLFNPPSEKPPVLNEKEREEFVRRLTGKGS